MFKPRAGEAGSKPQSSQRAGGEHAGEGTALFRVPSGRVSAGQSGFAPGAGGEEHDPALALGLSPGRGRGVMETEVPLPTTDVHKVVWVKGRAAHH